MYLTPCLNVVLMGVVYMFSADIFNHMALQHGFNVGLPDNLGETTFSHRYTRTHIVSSLHSLLLHCCLTVFSVDTINFH